MNMRLSVTLACILVAIPSLHCKKSIMKKIKKEIDLQATIDIPQKTTIPQITVWVHGTSMQPISQYFNNCPAGLTCAEKLPKNAHTYKITKALSTADAKNFPLENIYCFGWSGKLSFNERRIAAQELYTALEKLIATYNQEHNSVPYVRLITHSHGGNVALNLAFVHDTENKQVHIDELILMACPVQHATAEYISHKLFKKKYSIYSEKDLMQVMDPQGLYPHDEVHISPNKKKNKRRPLLSERIFEHDDMLQVAVRKDGRSLFHVEFILESMAQALPRLLHELDLQAQRRAEKKSSVYIDLHIKT